MQKLLYSLAVIIVITLAFGYFGHQASNLVQILLIIAIIAGMSAFIFQRKSKKIN
jgi:ABC-type transport system involved in cytochrome c biogenesis permease component